MKRLVSLSLSLVVATLLTAGCGSDSSTAGTSASQAGANLSGLNQADVYQGFVLGRVKLIPELQAGPVEVTTMDGQLLYRVDAGPHGFFWYEGFLPPDCRLRAQRGADTYELEHHGAWKGGTLYINAGTTLAAVYHRAHSELSQDEVESKIRRFFRLPDEMPMSWISTVRVAGFDQTAFFRSVQQRGLSTYLSALMTRMDQTTLARGVSDDLFDILGAAYSTMGAPLVNDALGDSVAMMGYNFTTAGALNQIEDALAVVSNQVADLTAMVQSNAAAAALQSVLQPLASNAGQIDNAMVNITNSVSAFKAAHPSDSDYQIPSRYPAAQDAIGAIQSLNLANLTDPIAANITDASPQGLYAKFVKQQMLGLSQSSPQYDGYVWRSNQLTEAQLQLIGSYATTLGQSAYLEAEFAAVQTGDLASAINTARKSIDRRAYQFQLSSQIVPDLFPSDEVIFDPEQKVMWFTASLGNLDAATASQVLDNLEVANYRDWGFPEQGMIDSMIKNRILPVSGITPSGSTWDDVTLGTWQTAFQQMGFNFPGGYVRENGDPTKQSANFDNESCWYNTVVFTPTIEYSGFPLGFYEWNGTNRNPSTSLPDSAVFKTNTLAVRKYGIGSPETNAAAAVIPPFSYDDHQNDSAQPDNHTPAWTQFYVSPFQLPFVGLVNVDFKYQNQLGKGYQAYTWFGTGVDGQTTFGTVPFDLTTRVAWSVDRTDLCTVSNYLTRTADQSYQGGFVTWFPPLDGSPITDPVNLKAELWAWDWGGPNRQTRRLFSTVKSITPQDGCRPYLNSIYAIPQNQVYDVSNAPVTVRITVIASYKDGRAIDISSDPNTTWTLKDSASGQTLNSSATGGFAVLNGQATNELYLTSGLPSNEVTYTATYSSRWASEDGTTPASKTFSGKFKVIKAPPTITSMTPAFGHASGGNTIRISGSGFTNGSVAYFGNTPATSTFFVTPNQLTVVVPSGPVGSVAVTVETSDGRTQTSANYNYTN